MVIRSSTTSLKKSSLLHGWSYKIVTSLCLLISSFINSLSHKIVTFPGLKATLFFLTPLPLVYLTHILIDRNGSYAILWSSQVDRPIVFVR